AYQFRVAASRGTLNGGAVVGAPSDPVSGATPAAAPQVVSVVAQPQALSFTAVGETKPLSLTARDGTGSPVPGTNFNAFSTDTSVATVDAMGRVTAKGVGAA